MEGFGIINDKAAEGGKAVAIRQLIADHGLNVVIVGRGADMASEEMREILSMEGVTVYQQGSLPISMRSRKDRSAKPGLGPRNRWGSPK